MKLTKQMEKEYIKKGGIRCPYCRSEDIQTVSSIEADDYGATQRVDCRNCKEEWTDIYKLVGIIEQEG